MAHSPGHSGTHIANPPVTKLCGGVVVDAMSERESMTRRDALRVAPTLAVAVALAAGTAEAARDPVAKATASPLEILVYEDPASPICQAFRRSIVPSYAASSRAQRMPMRFIDITTAKAEVPGLDGPIDIVPTAVVMHDGREIARVTGLWAPEMFHQMITHAVSGLD